MYQLTTTHTYLFVSVTNYGLLPEYMICTNRLRSAAADGGDLTATQDDISRVIESIRLRDQRIIAAESEMRIIKEELNRLADENRKLREETLPLVRIAKDRSHPLPNPEQIQQLQQLQQSLGTSTADIRTDKMGTGLSRKFSTKRLFLGSAPKNLSPTVMPVGQQTLQDNTNSLDPSVAATATPNHFTSNLASQPSPNQGQVPQLSPTSPAYATSVATQRFPRTVDTDSHYSSHLSLIHI